MGTRFGKNLQCVNAIFAAQVLFGPLTVLRTKYVYVVERTRISPSTTSDAVSGIGAGIPMLCIATHKATWDVEVPFRTRYI